MAECVHVITRTRPMNQKEKDRGSRSIVTHDSKKNQITIEHPDEKDNQKSFTFDSVFDWDSQQTEVYEHCAFKMIESVIEGYNGTVFAYGQTGCGKSHSMMGKAADPILKGIVPRSFEHIMSVVASAQSSSKQFLIRCSFIEIYNEEIRDLLSEDTKAKRDLKEMPGKGVFIKDQNQVIVKTQKEMVHYMNIGNDNRSVGATLMNAESSRSHSIFTAYVETMETLEGQEKDSIRAGKLNLVDLAGSERQSKTAATGDRLKEAMKINLSLSALGNVISALVSGKAKHIPYRDSKLTRLLQDSLGGNTKTLMICALSPADYNYDETLSTLKYGDRAKQIKNAPKVNEDPKDAMLREYTEEISRLRKQLNDHPDGIPNELAGILPGEEQGEGQRRKEGDGDEWGEDGEGFGLMEPGNPKFDDEDRKKLSFLEKHAFDLNLEHNLQSTNAVKIENEYEQEIKNRQAMEEKIKAMENATAAGTIQGGEATVEVKVDGQEESVQECVVEKEAVIDIDRIHKENEEREQQRQKANVIKKRRTIQLKEAVHTESPEEVEGKYREMQQKYKQICYDVRDAEREAYLSKQDQMDQVQNQEQELDFFRQVAMTLLSEEDIAKIRERIIWNEESDIYAIPNFFFNDLKQTTNMPKVGFQQTFTSSPKKNNFATKRNHKQQNVLVDLGADGYSPEHSPIKDARNQIFQQSPINRGRVNGEGIRQDNFDVRLKSPEKIQGIKQQPFNAINVKGTNDQNDNLLNLDGDYGGFNPLQLPPNKYANKAKMKPMNLNMMAPLKKKNSNANQNLDLGFGDDFDVDYNEDPCEQSWPQKNAKKTNLMPKSININIMANNGLKKMLVPINNRSQANNNNINSNIFGIDNKDSRRDSKPFPRISKGEGSVSINRDSSRMVSRQTNDQDDIFQKSTIGEKPQKKFKIKFANSGAANQLNSNGDADLVKGGSVDNKSKNFKINNNNSMATTQNPADMDSVHSHSVDKPRVFNIKSNNNNPATSNQMPLNNESDLNKSVDKPRTFKIKRKIAG